MQRSANFVASPLSLRMARVYKEAGQPLPVFDPTDDVMNYMVTEAVVFKRLRTDAKDREKAEFKKTTDDWKKQPLGSPMET